MNQLDEKTGTTMQWLEFGGDINWMAIIAAVAALGVLIFFFTRKNIE
ncbi:MAG: hypothetical protein JSU88_08790 [Nitrospinaceae bacterium]|jgi:hypothetical protein|nr:MAG: hypothetical protein JSU88_08790 [Nitrospinaceae bacterium]